MKIVKFATAATMAFAITACDFGPTQPDSLQDAFDAVDPVVVTFTASQGLPGGPFGAHGDRPFMAGMPFTGAPMGPANGRGPGAALPDNLKLTEAQKAQIEAAVTAFKTANAADIEAMKAAHQAARDARQAGKTKEEVKAILATAKPSAERLRTAAAALRTTIQGILTAEQKAWLEANRPSRPPRTP